MLGDVKLREEKEGKSKRSGFLNFDRVHTYIWSNDFVPVSVLMSQVFLLGWNQKFL